MTSIDLDYLQNEIAAQSAKQLKQLIQNKGEAIVEAINKQLDDAEEGDDVIFSLGHSIKIDLTDMNIKGKLSFAVKSSTELKTAIMDPENPELDLGDGRRGNTGAAGESDAGDQLVPAGEEPREIVDSLVDGHECHCTRCGEIFANEVDGQKHLNGPECEKAD